MLGGYYSLRLFLYNKINSYLEQKIQLKNLELGLFPPSITISDINEFVVKDKNIVSFDHVSAEIPLFSLFSRTKEVNISIYNPKVVLDDSLLKGKKKTSKKKSPFKINKVKIIDGELTFNAKKTSVKLLKFNLYTFPRQKATIYRLTSPHLKVAFPFSKKTVTLEGQVLSEFRQFKESWRLSKFYWETKYTNISANGRVDDKGRFDVNVYSQGSVRKILDPLLHQLSIRDFMYSSARIEKDQTGKITIDGDFNASTFTIHDEPFKNLNGTIHWDNKTKNIRVSTRMESKGLRASLDVNKVGKLVRIKARNLPAAKVAGVVNIDDVIPLGGIIREGRIKIKGKEFSGSAVLSQEPQITKPSQFNAAGTVDFTYNSKTKYTTFSTKNLETDFGRLLSLKGVSSPKEHTKLSLKFKAAVTHAEFLEKYTLFYINLPLKMWKLKGGNSSIDVDVKKEGKYFFIESDVHFRHLTSGIEEIESIKGHVSSEKNLTQGSFGFSDPKLSGSLYFIFDQKDRRLDIRFSDIRGESQKTLNILDIDLALSGNMKGDFTYFHKNGMPYPLVKGHFFAKQANFYDFIFDDLEGDLEYSGGTFLRNLTCRYMDSKGNADIHVDFNKQFYDIKGKFDDIDVGRLNPQFKGKADLVFKGSGAFDKDPIHLNINSGDITFYEDQPFKVKGDGTIHTDFSSFRLNSSGIMSDGKTVSPISFRLNRLNDSFTGDFEGELRDINLLIPWGNNKGSVRVKGNIAGPDGSHLKTEGYAEFKGSVLAFPYFPHALENFSGDMIFEDLNFTLRSIKGSMGGGAVQGSGYMTVKENRLDTLFLGISGTNMTLHPMDRTSFTGDADLTVRYLKDRDKLLLAGNIDIHSALWEREIEESISFNTSHSLTPSSSTIMDMVAYDLKLTGKENIRVRNSMGDMTGKFNLRVIGNTDFPVLLGVIESRNGTVNFSGKRFDLIKGKLTFNDKFQNDPIMNIESEAFIKNYHIKFNIKGPSSRIKPELISSPALPPRDILSLISVGELFRRPTSAELSNQVGAGTTGLIASELTDAIAKRTKKIFGNYILRIDPNISSNFTGVPFEESSRIIVGKEISKDFLVVYSTNFSTQRQQVVYLQYQISPSLSLIGMRNEDGRISIDLRFRRRH